MNKRKFLCISIVKTQLVIYCSLLFLFVSAVILFNLLASVAGDAKPGGKLAIVIDDFGLQRKGVSEMLSLDCKLTAAVMPFLDYTEDDVENALENGKEIIIHIPMQATSHDVPSHLGPRPVTINMSESEIYEWIHDALEEIPEASGANIHMGTISSTKEQVIRPVFNGLIEKNLYFLDSKTSSKSVCRKLAAETGIRFYENDVFLEHEEKSKHYVKKRLKKAMKIAKEKGECVAIGHVGYEGGKITAAAISELLDEFKKNNVELVFLSELSGRK